MSSPETPTKLRIAISGGGLAGAAIANALFRQPHLDVHVYESAAEFMESGQAVGIAINAQRALSMIVPDAEDLFQRAGAIPKSSTRIMIGSGPAAGTKVIDLAEEEKGYTIHRAVLLKELLAPLPQSSLHANKKLVKIDNLIDALKLHFEDGSSEVVDALIGADGIFGFVRQHVLGLDHPATKPVPAGWSGLVNMVPYPKGVAKLGAEVLEEHRQYGWVGDGGIFIHDSIANKLVMCIGTRVDRNLSKERRKPVSRESLEEGFAPWVQGAEGDLARGMIDLLLDQENPSAYAQWEHQDAPTYVAGRACIAGDAGHAMTPWQGSGAGMAIEDAVVLGAVFSAIKTREQIEGALKAFDAIRRPRTQRIVESSRHTGRILSGLEEGVGLDPDKMRDALASRWDYIYDFDIREHGEQALALLGTPLT